MSEVALFHQALRYCHIGLGFLGLAVFWVPVFARKGGRLHVRCGRLFVWCAYAVGSTALVSCAWALADPLGFIGVTGELSPERRAELSEALRFFFAILGALALWLLSGTVLGVRVVRTRRAPERLSGPFLRGLYWLSGLASLALFAFGLAHLAAGHGGRYVIALVLGAIGVFDARDAFRFLANPRPTPMAWWYKHMECMLGAGVAFHTAFLVFGFGRLTGVGLFSGPLALVPWLVPTAVGIPAIVLWTRYYRRKFGELGAASPAAGTPTSAAPAGEGPNPLSPAAASGAEMSPR